MLRNIVPMTTLGASGGSGRLLRVSVSSKQYVAVTATAAALGCCARQQWPHLSPVAIGRRARRTGQCGESGFSGKRGRGEGRRRRLELSVQAGEAAGEGGGVLLRSSALAVLVPRVREAQHLPHKCRPGHTSLSPPAFPGLAPCEAMRTLRAAPSSPKGPLACCTCITPLEYAKGCTPKDVLLI